MAAAFAAAGLTVFERGWLSSNNVLFTADAASRNVDDDDGASSAVLVDSGYLSHADQTVALVRHALGARPLARVVNTHLHADHCGGNAALAEAFGCAIDVPAAEASTVDAWDERALTFVATGQHCPRFVRTGTVEPGSTVRLGALDWQAIASPGHDPRSFVLHQPEHELLLSADALWENGFGVIFPELDGEGGFDATRATLEHLRGLRVRWVVPGHGRPFGDVGAALDRAQQRLDGLAADPVRHARHAAKVLIKFHLLEVQAEPQDALHRWLAVNGCIAAAHARYFAERPYPAWCDGLVGELVASGALALRDGVVANR